jgi:hypothetical protein
MENSLEPLVNDRSIARQTVAYAPDRILAMGIEPSVEAVRLYELYADGYLTPAQLRAGFVKLHGLAPLPPPAAPGTSPG